MHSGLSLLEHLLPLNAERILYLLLFLQLLYSYLLLCFPWTRYYVP